LWLGWGAAAGEGRKLALGALAALGLGALLAGVQLAPTLAALPEYVRPGGGDYAYFAAHSLHPLRLATSSSLS